MATKTAERTEFLADIVVTAVEGGTGYWAQVAQYQYEYNGELTVYAGAQDGDGTKATLNELNADGTGYGDEALILDGDAVARGLGRIKRGEVGVNATLLGLIVEADRENDAGNIDAGAADVIAQAGLLGEVRYG